MEFYALFYLGVVRVERENKKPKYATRDPAEWFESKSDYRTNAFSKRLHAAQGLECDSNDGGFEECTNRSSTRFRRPGLGGNSDFSPSEQSEKSKCAPISIPIGEVHVNEKFFWLRLAEKSQQRQLSCYLSQKLILLGSAMSDKFDHREIEKRWQQRWQEAGVFRAPEKPKAGAQYVLDMFPYPSGDGLHVGHPEGYTATDIFSRYLRMQGIQVLHPMGWDAFGLPAENAAIKKKIHPRTVTEQNIANFKRQIQSLGFSYDWDREVNTTDPKYYKWTQWIFLQLFKKGLAYEKEAPIWWCPKDKTGLANEEVVNGKCDRCGTTVEKKMLKQWMLKITDYADRLLDGLEKLDWPEGIKALQRNWIGKSEGAEVVFEISDQVRNDKNHNVTVFTTRPDTLFGATYMVLSPEHPLVNDITTADQKKAVEQYVKDVAAKSDLERTALEKEKTGVFTGAYAINPVNHEKIPVWIADYVLMSYGTGAIMAVPAHDERDFAFAKNHDLSFIEVIVSPEVGGFYDVAAGKESPMRVWSGEGVLINSGKFNGLSSHDARKKIVAWLQKEGKAQPKVNYKLRDWVFSRQRYWGEPIPLVHCPKDGVVPVDEKDLPVLLPDVEKYEPTGTGESPLADIDDWVNTTCPNCGGPAKRETNTMPQWAGSCWYYLRFTDPQNEKAFASAKAMKSWLPVDLYVGGAEHAVLHLLYARFWHKVLYDMQHIPKEVGDEPFQKLKNQGLILGPDGEKMSKSRGNVINPDEIVEKFGADTLRMYEMFMGPFEDAKPWDTNGIVGVRRFLEKVWRIGNKKQAKNCPSDVVLLTHKTIKKVTRDIEEFKFNTAVSSLMILANAFDKLTDRPREEFEYFLLLLKPFAPHIVSEILEKHQRSNLSGWPTYDNKLISDIDTVTLAVQVNGKLRGTLWLPIGSEQKHVEKAAKAEPNVAKFLTSEPKKVIFVKDKLINFVV